MPYTRWSPNFTAFETSQSEINTHDISHHVSVDGNARPFACVENFSAVCYFIGEKYKGLSPPSIILHTSNPVGAQRMRHILDSYGLKSEYQPGKPVNH
jgi:hypothetical protein